MTMTLDRRTFLKKAGALLALPLIGQACAPFSPVLQRDVGIARSNGGVPILLYHDLSDDTSDEYTVTAAQFAAQMEWLYSNGYQAISLSGLGDRLIPEKAVVITFDDGYASFMDFAFPLFRGYGFKATINIIGEYIGSYIPDGRKRPMLSWDEYRYLTASGIVNLGCHTYNLHVFRHRGAAGVSEGTLRQDLDLFQKTMKREIGKPTEIIAWPYGFYTDSAKAVAAQTGIRYMLTSQRGFLDPAGSFTAIPRINIGGDTTFRTFKSLLGDA